jgi:AcrR family transcriptional regulator
MPRRRTNIEPRIIAAARKRFLHEGVDGASLRAIAADAGTSIGMVYYYFKTKDDLFLAVVEQVYAKLLAELTAATSGDVAPEERIRRLYRRIGAISDLEGQTVRLVVREALVSSKRLGKVIARFQRGHIPLVLAALRDGAVAGRIRDDLSPWLLLFVTFAIGAVPQLALRNLGERVGYTGPRGEALSDLLVEILLGGISAGTRPDRIRNAAAIGGSVRDASRDRARRR